MIIPADLIRTLRVRVELNLCEVRLHKRRLALSLLIGFTGLYSKKE